MAWDPAQYTKFSDARERPFHELIARVGARHPAAVLDVGCGPGTATATLLARWPSARVLGVDSSPEMLTEAQGLELSNDAGGDLRFKEADANTISVGEYDLVVSNAMLQWLPNHRDLLTRWADELHPGAWLAFQVPGNYTAPSHQLMRDVAAEGPWEQPLRGVLRGPDTVDDPQDYADLLMDQGLNVDAWETTYIQWLTGADPVLEWVKGTGLRPALTTLDALGGDLTDAFIDAYAQRLRQAYPSRPSATGPITALPFRRIFVVAHKD